MGDKAGILVGLLPEMDRFADRLVAARREINPNSGRTLSARVLVAMLIIVIESYTGQKITRSYKNGLITTLEEIVAAIDPEIGLGVIDGALRARERGEELLPAWNGPRFPLRGDYKGPPFAITFERYCALGADKNSDNHGEIDG